jgi:tripeptide aminopeptidase
VRRAGEAERDQLHSTFAELCRIESPSGQERAVADRVTTELQGMGLEVQEDDAGAAAGSDAGNLLARIPARGEGGPGLLLCAHLDTVPPIAPVDPVLEDGHWHNRNQAILGADNKAAVAAMLTLGHRLIASEGPPPVSVELLFTVSEENGLRGAANFDASGLRSNFGYVFDHASPLGEIVLAAPTYQRFAAELRGRAAHAGIRPENGRSAIVAAARAIAAIPLGRLDETTTCNVGLIRGGTASNVVPERCTVEGEVRGHEDTRVESVLTEMIDAFQDSADGAECDLDITVERLFRGYRVSPNEPAVTLAEQALRATGYTPSHITTGGGADANALRTNGFPCVNLADGSERNHQPDERISADSLNGLYELMIALVSGLPRLGMAVV